MRSLLTYQFEGETLTAMEVHKRVPALTIQTIRLYLKRGLDSRVKMLSYAPVGAMKIAGKKSAERYKNFSKRKGIK